LIVARIVSINMSQLCSLDRRINETQRNRRPYREMSQSIRGKKEVRDAESQRRFPRRMARYAQATLTTTEGMKVDLWFRETLGFRKIDGKWTITHEHSSVPFYMDGSFKAAVDLKP
jgi:hypothetical protein